MRRRVMASLRTSGEKELEYLVSNGGYAITDIVQTTGKKIELFVKFRLNVFSGDKVLFGNGRGDYDNDTTIFRLCTNSNFRKYFFDTPWRRVQTVYESFSYGTSIHEMYFLENQHIGHKIVDNGVEVSSDNRASYYGSVTNYPFCFFAHANGDGLQQSVSLYYLKLLQDGVETIDAVAKRSKSGRVGLFDKVSEKYFYSANGNEFTEP